MNLWVRRTGQLLLAALFLLACEDENSLLGFRNPTSKFDVSFIDFNIGEGSVMSLEGVVSDNAVPPTRLLIGEYQDPVIGSIRAMSFTDYLPQNSALINIASIYDSVVMYVDLDLYNYGLTGQQTQGFTVHRITEDSISFIAGTRYYSDSFLEYDPTPLGEAVFTVHADSIKKQQGLPENSRTKFQATARLDDDLGMELFTLAKFDLEGEYSNFSLFRGRMKGFAFTPSQGNGILGFNTVTESSRLIVYYHTEDGGSVKDTLRLNFVFTSRSFHNVSANLTGEWAAITQPNQGIDPPSGLRYIQTGTPHITRIDLNDFYTNFADTLQSNVLINTAYIIIESVQKVDGFEPIPYFEFRVMNENDNFLKANVSADSALMAKYRVFSSQNNFLPLTDGGQEAISLVYDATTNTYGTSLALFAQNLLDNRALPERLRYLGIYPATSLTRLNVPNFGKIVNRTIFHKSNIKLRVYYTYPANSNQ